MTVGAFEPDTRVLVKALKVPGTVIGQCEDYDENMSVAVYHVRLDVPIVANGEMLDLVHAAETAIVRLPPPVAVCSVNDIVKWQPGKGWGVRIGRVVGVQFDEGRGPYYNVYDANGTLWELDANQGTVFVVKRETEGTEKLPI